MCTPTANRNNPANMSTTAHYEACFLSCGVFLSLFSELLRFRPACAPGQGMRHPLDGCRTSRLRRRYCVLGRHVLHVHCVWLTAQAAHSACIPFLNRRFTVSLFASLCYAHTVLRPHTLSLCHSVCSLYQPWPRTSWCPARSSTRTAPPRCDPHSPPTRRKRSRTCTSVSHTVLS